MRRGYNKEMSQTSLLILSFSLVICSHTCFCHTRWDQESPHRSHMLIMFLRLQNCEEDKLFFLILLHSLEYFVLAVKSRQNRLLNAFKHEL